MFDNTQFISKIGGISSLNYIVKANNKEYVLKQYRYDTIADIKKINNITFFLNDNNICVVCSIKTKDEKYLFRNNRDFYSLFPKITGRTLH